jgi:TonB family protein
LLFLTSKRSKEEVVCQVLRTRSFRPTVCYVELQFTEERPDFWDVAFPEGKTSGSELSGTAHVEAEETTKGDTGTPVAPHSAGDVDRLKKEAETLREQLQAREKKNAAEAAAQAAVEATAREAAAREAAKAAEVRPTASSKAKLEIASVNDPSPESAKTAEKVTAPLMPAVTDKKEAARPVVGMTLPSQKSESKKPVEEAQDLTEDLLPKPELDFSKVRQSAVHVGHKAKGADSGKYRVIGLSALLVLAVAGGTWYGQWWQYLPLGKKAVAVAPAKAVKANPRGATAGNGSAAKHAAGVAGNVGAAAEGATGANAARTAAGDAGTKEDKSAGAEENKNGEGVAGEAETKESAVEERAAGKAASKENGGASTAAGPSVTEPVANDAPVTPAKLLKATMPVYPPDAMRNYVTGDVKAEVVVEATGRVGEVRVISGPKALRAAAVEALKQYEYAPGTQGGKAIASKVTVTVKFWFNP